MVFFFFWFMLRLILCSRKSTYLLTSTDEIQLRHSLLCLSQPWVLQKYLSLDFKYLLISVRKNFHEPSRTKFRLEMESKNFIRLSSSQILNLLSLRSAHEQN